MLCRDETKFWAAAFSCFVRTTKSFVKFWMVTIPNMRRVCIFIVTHTYVCKSTYPIGMDAVAITAEESVASERNVKISKLKWNKTRRVFFFFFSLIVRVCTEITMRSDSIVKIFYQSSIDDRIDGFVRILIECCTRHAWFFSISKEK